MKKVAIVTDSTADLPLSYYEGHEVFMVPLVVRFGEESHKDWIEMPPSRFYQRLRSSSILPKTSQPSVADFAETYRKLASQHEHIVSVHLSSKLSGTVQSAEIASQEVDVPVTIVDTKLASLGTGMVLDALVEARDGGADGKEIADLAWDISGRVKILFTVGTLKYLEMGGRIGKAQALVGSLLNIKPLLTLQDGIVIPYKKIKGTRRVYEEMVAFLKQNIGGGGLLHLGLAHADYPAAIVRLKKMIEEAGIKPSILIESEVGAVIGTYTGPDSFAIMFHEE
ncbi:MAG TPA: DegV family protein [Actinobacteria bacterium]|nr:DegV family protein [Actinomycetota bacterium]